ncbi:MAG: hypothetical protein M0D57_08675 [Sphingobacteriales bacterium JAD_PAG50586_3]|nr:MAG: hypothetical protein M0D57_08675 [Sphingobacteriales bacterium JAD_PAG50586_3]
MCSLYGQAVVAKVTITGNPTIAYGTLASGNESFCTTGNPSAITFATEPSGGSGNFIYQWYYKNGINACPSGSSTTGWTIISGATATTYQPAAGLAQSRTYACFVTPQSSCSSTPAWASQCRQVTIGSNVVFGTLVNADESFCQSGNPTVINFSLYPTGNNGVFTYQWYY